MNIEVMKKIYNAPVTEAIYVESVDMMALSVPTGDPLTEGEADVRTFDANPGLDESDDILDILK